jgi:hypothetical protein
MVIFVFVVGDVVMVLTGVICGAMVVSTFVIPDVPKLVRGNATMWTNGEAITGLV